MLPSEILNNSYYLLDHPDLSPSKCQEALAGQKTPEGRNPPRLSLTLSWVLVEAELGIKTISHTLQSSQKVVLCLVPWQNHYQQFSYLIFLAWTSLCDVTKACLDPIMGAACMLPSIYRIFYPETSWQVWFPFLCWRDITNPIWGSWRVKEENENRI